MKLCSICHKISATNDDHLNCKEKLRIELEAEDFKSGIPDRLDMAKNTGDIQTDIKALMGHISREKKSDS